MLFRLTDIVEVLTRTAVRTRCTREHAMSACLITHARIPFARTHALFRARHVLTSRAARRLSDTRRSLPPWRYRGTARMQRQQFAAPHIAMCLPVLQEWLPVEALPELVAALDTPLLLGADGVARPWSRRGAGT
jgi:hypothetical protein